MARECGIADARIFNSKRKAVRQLRASFFKPDFIITDYLDSEMRGDEFIRLARQISPQTKVILFSAVVGNADRWNKFAGLDAPIPDLIIEKPDTQRLRIILANGGESN